MHGFHKQVSERAQEALKFLGDFRPTKNVLDRQIKGMLNGAEIYLFSIQLRRLAEDLVEVANWLDRRRDRAFAEVRAGEHAASGEAHEAARVGLARE